MHPERNITTVEYVISLMPIYNISVPDKYGAGGTTLVYVLFQSLQLFLDHRNMEAAEFFINIQFVHCSTVF